MGLCGCTVGISYESEPYLVVDMIQAFSMLLQAPTLHQQSISHIQRKKGCVCGVVSDEVELSWVFRKEKRKRQIHGTTYGLCQIQRHASNIPDARARARVVCVCVVCV